MSLSHVPVFSLHALGHVEFAPISPFLSQVIWAQEFPYAKHVRSGYALKGPGILVIKFSFFLILVHLSRVLRLTAFAGKGNLWATWFRTRFTSSNSQRPPISTMRHPVFTGVT